LVSLALVWWVLPERILGVFVSALGKGEAWNAGQLTESDEVSALQFAHRTRVVLVCAVFFVAFVAGAVATWARLAGSS
jgi:hypothetical protein